MFTENTDSGGCSRGALCPCDDDLERVRSVSRIKREQLRKSSIFSACSNAEEGKQRRGRHRAARLVKSNSNSLLLRDSSMQESDDD